MNPITSHQRTLLGVAIGWLIVSVILLGALGAPRGNNSLGVLELATTAKGFRSELLSSWSQAPEVGTDIPGEQSPDLPESQIPSFGRLRVNLFFDSVGLVPAYVSLLLFFTLAFWPPSSSRLMRHLSCVPAVAAGLFDIAENSMLAGALDDLIQSSLTDATVADVRFASRVKWCLLGVALAVLAYRLARGWASDGLWHRVAVVCGGVAALAFLIGGAIACLAINNVGMGAMGLVFLVLSCRVRAKAASPAPST